METLTVILIIFFGFACGSFLNVVIYRVPREMSLLKPPSTCPSCHSRIKPYDNIPVFSYLILGGRCRRCKAKISAVYPLVEILTAASFLLSYFAAGQTLSLTFIANCLFAEALIALGFIDYFHQILPHVITIPGLILALIYSLFREDLTFRQAVIGSLAGAGFLLIIYFSYLLIRKKEGLGLGDVVMLLMVGAYLGVGRTFLTLIIASLIGALVGLFFILKRKKDLQFALPFGSFLAMAAFIAALWGEKIIFAYLGLFRR